ncbi:MAG: hypothetical protein JW727_05510 [Candidatus Aenigmarchaeota archaeon]|nr:hypothetical protein [Candidatus Aenigmarchaeota archaeon]
MKSVVVGWVEGEIIKSPHWNPGSWVPEKQRLAILDHMETFGSWAYPSSFEAVNDPLLWMQNGGKELEVYGTWKEFCVADVSANAVGGGYTVYVPENLSVCYPGKPLPLLPRQVESKLGIYYPDMKSTLEVEFYGDAWVFRLVPPD